jgi:diketogulonate reductase-like aldo/keto reductase
MGDREAERVVAEAIGLGYRLIDTAHAYGNESGVGRGIRAGGVAREDLFVATKLNAEWHGRGEARDAFEMSAARLGLDHIDLFLIQSWSPLGTGGDLLAEPTITTIAGRHERTPAQIILRWHIELGLIPTPKSSSSERLARNLAVFDFSLTPAEVGEISALDRGESAAVDSDSYGH